VSISARQNFAFAIIDQFTVDASWDGSPLKLQINENAVIPQTPNGSTIFAASNLAVQNNLGQLSLNSNGQLRTLNVPALANQPVPVIQNWQSNSLSVTNISPNALTPIQIQLIGPGIPGTTPKPFPTGPPGVSLDFGETAQGNAAPQLMQLVISSLGTTGIVGVIGGPPDPAGNNGYLFAVNSAANTGPPTSNPPPPGYYATTTSGSYTFSFNWGGSVVFVANLSAQTAQPVTVLLRAL
jgi:hypothetical protein